MTEGDAACLAESEIAACYLAMRLCELTTLSHVFSSGLLTPRDHHRKRQGQKSLGLPKQPFPVRFLGSGLLPRLTCRILELRTADGFRQLLNSCQQHFQGGSVIRVNIWLLLHIGGGPFYGCPSNKTPTILVSILGPLIFWELSFGREPVSVLLCCDFQGNAETIDVYGRCCPGRWSYCRTGSIKMARLRSSRFRQLKF